MFNYLFQRVFIFSSKTVDEYVLRVEQESKEVCRSRKKLSEFTIALFTTKSKGRDSSLECSNMNAIHVISNTQYSEYFPWSGEKHTEKLTFIYIENF